MGHSNGLSHAIGKADDESGQRDISSKEKSELS